MIVIYDILRKTFSVTGTFFRFSLTILLASVGFSLLTGCSVKERNVKAKVTTVRISQGQLNEIKDLIKGQKKKLPFGESSYLLTNQKQDGGQLVVNLGMAVAIASDKNSCSLLTNKHLVQAGKTIHLRQWRSTPAPAARQPKAIVYSARVEAVSQKYDLAMLKIARVGGCSTSVLAFQDPEIGQEITLLGQPIPGGAAKTRGIISNYWHLKDRGRTMVSDAVTTPGFSGSGVFLPDQSIAGLASGKTSDAGPGFAYLIPVTSIRDFLHQVQDKKLASPTQPKAPKGATVIAEKKKKVKTPKKNRTQYTPKKSFLQQLKIMRSND